MSDNWDWLKPGLGIVADDGMFNQGGYWNPGPYRETTASHKTIDDGMFNRDEDQSPPKPNHASDFGVKPPEFTPWADSRAGEPESPITPLPKPRPSEAAQPADQASPKASQPAPVQARSYAGQAPSSETRPYAPSQPHPTADTAGDARTTIGASRGRPELDWAGRSLSGEEFKPFANFQAAAAGVLKPIFDMFPNSPQKADAQVVAGRAIQGGATPQQALSQAIQTVQSGVPGTAQGTMVAVNQKAEFYRRSAEAIREQGRIFLEGSAADKWFRDDGRGLFNLKMLGASPAYIAQEYQKIMTAAKQADEMATAYNDVTQFARNTGMEGSLAAEPNKSKEAMTMEMTKHISDGGPDATKFMDSLKKIPELKPQYEAILPYYVDAQQKFADNLDGAARKLDAAVSGEQVEAALKKMTPEERKAAEKIAGPAPKQGEGNDADRMAYGERFRQAVKGVGTAVRNDLGRYYRDMEGVEATPQESETRSRQLSKAYDVPISGRVKTRGDGAKFIVLDGKGALADFGKPVSEGGWNFVNDDFRKEVRTAKQEMKTDLEKYAAVYRLHNLAVYDQDGNYKQDGFNANASVTQAFKETMAHYYRGGRGGANVGLLNIYKTSLGLMGYASAWISTWEQLRAFVEGNNVDTTKLLSSLESQTSREAIDNMLRDAKDEMAEQTEDLILRAGRAGMTLKELGLPGMHFESPDMKDLQDFMVNLRERGVQETKTRLERAGATVGPDGNLRMMLSGIDQAEAQKRAADRAAGQAIQPSATAGQTIQPSAQANMAREVTPEMQRGAEFRNQVVPSGDINVEDALTRQGQPAGERSPGFISPEAHKAALNRRQEQLAAQGYAPHAGEVDPEARAKYQRNLEQIQRERRFYGSDHRMKGGPANETDEEEAWRRAGYLSPEQFRQIQKRAAYASEQPQQVSYTPGGKDDPWAWRGPQARSDRVARYGLPLDDRTPAFNLRASGVYEHSSEKGKALLNAMRLSQRHMPEGVTVKVISGFRPGGVGTSRHTKWGNRAEASAYDVQLYYNGRPIPNRGRDETGLYREFARHIHEELAAVNPALAKMYNFGGAHGTSIGRDNGIPDIMHHDMGGRTRRSGRGSPYHGMHIDDILEAHRGKQIPSDDKPKMLVAEGLYKNYQGRDPEEIREHFRKYAASKGMEAEFIDDDGSVPGRKLAEIKKRIASGQYAHYAGFSQGGNMLAHLGVPVNQRTIIGASNRAHDTERLEGRHMDLPAALAAKYEGDTDIPPNAQLAMGETGPWASGSGDPVVQSQKQQPASVHEGVPDVNDPGTAGAWEVMKNVISAPERAARAFGEQLPEKPFTPEQEAEFAKFAAMGGQDYVPYGPAKEIFKTIAPTAAGMATRGVLGGGPVGLLASGVAAGGTQYLSNAVQGKEDVYEGVLTEAALNAIPGAGQLAAPLRRSLYRGLAAEGAGLAVIGAAEDVRHKLAVGEEPTLSGAAWGAAKTGGIPLALAGVVGGHAALTAMRAGRATTQAAVDAGAQPNLARRLGEAAAEINTALKSRGDAIRYTVRPETQDAVAYAAAQRQLDQNLAELVRKPVDVIRREREWMNSGVPRAVFEGAEASGVKLHSALEEADAAVRILAGAHTNNSALYNRITNSVPTTAAMGENAIVNAIISQDILDAATPAAREIYTRVNNTLANAYYGRANGGVDVTLRRAYELLREEARLRAAEVVGPGEVATRHAAAEVLGTITTSINSFLRTAVGNRAPGQLGLANTRHAALRTAIDDADEYAALIAGRGIEGHADLVKNIFKGVEKDKPITPSVLRTIEDKVNSYLRLAESQGQAAYDEMRAVLQSTVFKRLFGAGVTPDELVKVKDMLTRVNNPPLPRGARIRHRQFMPRDTEGALARTADLIFSPEQLRGIQVTYANPKRLNRASTSLSSRSDPTVERILAIALGHATGTQQAVAGGVAAHSALQVSKNQKARWMVEEPSVLVARNQNRARRGEMQDAAFVTGARGVGIYESARTEQKKPKPKPVGRVGTAMSPHLTGKEDKKRPAAVTKGRTNMSPGLGRIGGGL